ncbi:S-layer homology domain-containing protein [Bacillus smithii]|uniref:S-layer homology domain-containing protein n=1 Tax=Bacillus smithii TaxID=1479 RepID=UPI002E1B14AC|nr:S-layer homology domain-containing protein [Bacillus smithii]MED4927422.1 S-layer homology domain-containing protein [Bacillus smithii]
MAYQPKSYRKFVATAATATLVATAVTPAFAAENLPFNDVNKNYEKAVSELYSKGIVKGVSKTEFGTYKSLKRGDAAVIIARALELDTKNAPDAGFKDVNSKIKGAVNALVAKGIISGVSKDKFDPNSPLTRGQMAKILVNAYPTLKDEAKETPFKDLTADFKPYIEALYGAGITGGTSDTTYGTTQKITRGDFAKLLYKAMNYKKSVPESIKSIDDITVDEGTKLEDVKLPEKVTVVYSDKSEKEASVKWDTSKVDTSKPGTYKVEGTVEGTDLKAFVNVVVKSTTPKVASVKAINATQVQVTFNKEVDKADAENTKKYSIGNTNPNSANLGADKKTVTLTFANASDVEVTNKVLVVEPVKTAADANVSTEKYVQVFTYEDKEAPQITSVESKTKGNVATSLTVKASEPIQSSLAKVDGSYVNIDFNGTDTATITGLSLETGKTHTIELINLTDKGGNVTVSTSASFNVTVDTVAPTATLSQKSDKEILVTFSKPMDVNSVLGALASSNNPVKDETLANVVTGTPTVVPDTNDTQFIIPVTDILYANKSSRTLTVVLPNTIQDKLGNNITAGTQTVTLTKDTVKPVATGYNVVKNSNGEVTAIEVSFSEGLKAGTPEVPSIVNENGVDVSSTLLGGLKARSVSDGDKKVVYAANTPAKVSGKYAFSFPAGLVTDQSEAGNKSDAFNYTIDFGAGATTFDLSSVDAENNVITVDFGRAVKGGAVANSATDLANYTLGGKPLPEGTKIVLNETQDKATITLPSESIEKTDPNAVFTVANVKSLNNELLNSYKGTVSVVDNVKPVLNSASLTSDNKLLIGFSETLDVDPVVGDLVIKVNGKTVTANSTGLGKNLIVTKGTGSDAGKYLVNLDDLVVQGEPTDSGDNVPATPTYFDVNNNGTYDDETDIKIADGPVDNFKITSSPAINSVTVSTLATGVSTAKDAASNPLKNDVTVKVK